MYVTEIKAIDPKDGNVKTWDGPRVPGVSIATAQDYCDKNGLGYCKVIGRFIIEADAQSDSLEPSPEDWQKALNIGNIENN